ncbi:MAG: hypothetical protein BRD31_03105 [Bacteroidetes bacterium QH_2_64_26]|jgi:hypothetical protein|nr:MAG: hypothetical protein BRD31_03105 [Bacteroidetes bacterium QH_2_64_26]PSQ75357.1 MAG: hypothetical protein BRD33_04290 [Bacteroidetes bacterium QH_6_63_17]PSR00345.1 MAG: hypothetical protein BRD51_00535 [Bacteroidetes bacterium SW_11_64_17]
MSQNAILPIAIWSAIALAGLSVLGMGIFGIRSLVYGKVEPLSIAIIAIPGVLIAVLGATMETWVQAGIYTLVVMFGLATLALLLTGLRKLFIS